ncbi:MAG: ATP-binding protein, partial [Anaerovoracaceae bacterium]
MYYNRAIEEKTIKIKNQFPILLLTGPRQVGKTTLLKEIFGDEYHFVTLDDMIIKAEIIRDTALFLKNNPKKLIIDEIQYATEILPYIKKVVDERQKDGQYLLTGSQAFSLMKGVSESLAGRVGILELQGISLREKYKIKFNKAFIPDLTYIEQRENEIIEYGDIWDTIHRGSMPRMVFNEDIDWEIYYSSYVQTYIERDIRSLVQVADENLFVKFLVAIAARTGQLLNYNSIAKDIGVSIDTVKRWTSILETSRIIRLLYPYSNNHLKRALKTPKVYFMD